MLIRYSAWLACIALVPVFAALAVFDSGHWAWPCALAVALAALGLRDRLQSLGSTHISRTSSTGGDLYRVRVGPLASVDQADALLSTRVPPGRGAVVVAGVAYGSRGGATGRWVGGFDPLPAARAEGEAVAALWGASRRSDATFLTGAEGRQYSPPWP